jgi:hypothetical protein
MPAMLRVSRVSRRRDHTGIKVTPDNNELAWVTTRQEAVPRSNQVARDNCAITTFQSGTQIDTHDNQGAGTSLCDTHNQEPSMRRKQYLNSASHVVADNGNFACRSKFEAESGQLSELRSVAALTLGMDCDVGITDTWWWARVRR